MRDDLTMIYYTANTEDPALENNVRNFLVKQANGIPIVSVSQKPIDFGTNICVGEVGFNHYNGKRL